MRQYVPALLIIASFLALGPGEAAASGPRSSPDVTHPSGLAVTATPSAPLREVFGFALASSLSDPNVGYTTWDFSMLSTVAFFGLHVQDDGTFAADSDASVWNSSQLSGLISTAHAHGTKVVLTIVLQDFTAGTAHMCAGLGHFSTTTANTVAAVKAKGVDGVNVDYEGLNGSCGTANSSWARQTFTSSIASLRQALPQGSYLSVDTYASAAADPIGFFDVPSLAPNVDSFFVMAYDLEYSNYSHAPPGCSSFCLGPTAPLNGYYYNDTTTASQYVSVAGAAKVLLGIPYYGRKACVAAATPNQYPTSGVVADSYLDASTEATSGMVQPGTYATHRDGNDPSGGERWDTWVNTSLNCTRELYWDDTTSLAAKYDLINRDNLRGVGIWNLNYGGGAPELWQLLRSRFASTGWNSLGGALTSAPEATSWSSTQANVFIRGTDNSLQTSGWSTGGLSGWQSLGGVLTSDPGAVSWGPNRIDVFVRGTDNALYHKVWAGAWYGWESLGGVLTSGPGVASWNAGRLDVFVRGTDNALYHKVWDGSAWSGWESLGGGLTSDPTAVSWAPNRVDVFVRGTDNALWHKWWDGSRWNGWERLGGTLTSSPEATSCSSGHLAVFASGAGSSFYELRYDGAWGQWQGLGGQFTSAPGAVCLAGSTVVEVFGRGTDNALWQMGTPGS